MKLLRWLGRKLRAPGHILRNLVLAWYRHDLSSYVHRVTQTPGKRFALRLALTVGSLGIACLTAAVAYLLLTVARPLVTLAVFGWVLWMDLPGIWT